MANPITDKKVKDISDFLYDLGIELISDEIIDIAVDILYLIALSTFDESDAVDETGAAKIKADKDAIKKLFDGFIGDGEKTAAFIRFRLDKIAAANNGDSNAG